MPWPEGAEAMEAVADTALAEAGAAPAAAIRLPGLDTAPVAAPATALAPPGARAASKVMVTLRIEAAIREAIPVDM